MVGTNTKGGEIVWTCVENNIWWERSSTNPLDYLGSIKKIWIRGGWGGEIGHI